MMLFIKPNKIFKQSGLSLVELMVAVTIGLVLLTGVLQIYLGSKQTYRMQDALSRLQENGRIAIEMLQRDIRPAGFMGCRKLDATVAPVATGAMPALVSGNTAIVGNEGLAASWNPGLPATITTATAKSDVLSIQRGSGCTVALNSNMGSVSSDIIVDISGGSSNCNFQANEVLLVSDCNNMDIFRVTGAATVTAPAVPAMPGPPPVPAVPASTVQTIKHELASNSSASLFNIYKTDAELMRFQNFSYFIAPDSNNDPALWRFDQTRALSAVAPENPQQVVAGIADMQVEYGEDTNADNSPDYYVKADSVTDWSKVISARISLLARTREDNLTESAKTYTIGGNSFTDRRISRIYTTTILLRNRFQ